MKPRESCRTARTVPSGNPSAVVKCVRMRGGASAAAAAQAAISSSAEPMICRLQAPARAILLTACSRRDPSRYWLGTHGTIGAGAVGAGAWEVFHHGTVRAQAKLRAQAKFLAQAKLFDQR